MIYSNFISILFLISFFVNFFNQAFSIAMRPGIVASWRFGSLATSHGKDLLCQGKPALDIVASSINIVERDNQDQYFVGVGGYPNAEGEMELDAAIMDHNRRYGAVMSLKEIPTPISVAKSILEDCPHNVLTGQGALDWALSHGFKTETIITKEIKQEWEAWKKNQVKISNSEDQHDTIGVICLDIHGQLSAGTSTSGWKFKHRGRVGDSPIIGSGLYCDGKIGAAVATGDGEEIMRICLSFLVVEYMRQGKSPNEACILGIERLEELLPPSSTLDKMHSKLIVGVVAMDKNGQIGAASTIDINNPHREDNFFPVVHWNSDFESSQMIPATRLGIQTLK